MKLTEYAFTVRIADEFLTTMDVQYRLQLLILSLLAEGRQRNKEYINLTENDKKKSIAQSVAKELGVLYGERRVLLHRASQALADAKTTLKVSKT